MQKKKSKIVILNRQKKDQKNKEQRREQKTHIKKISKINHIITLNLSGLNTPIKK